MLLHQHSSDTVSRFITVFVHIRGTPQYVAMKSETVLSK